MFPSGKFFAIPIRIAALSVILSLPSLKAAAISVDAIGDSFTINFDSMLQPGLTSSADFVVTDIVADALGGQTWTLDVLLGNTSTTPITDARVSILGFNTDSSFDPTDSSVTGTYGLLASGNMPIAGHMDVCLKAGGGTANCAGGGGGGVTIGETGAFTVTLNYDLTLSELVLDDFFVRYQSVVGATSAAGVVGSGSQIPIPSSLLLMTSGLIALGSVGRNRRNTIQPTRRSDLFGPIPG